MTRILAQTWDNGAAGTSSAITNTDTMPTAVEELVPPRRPFAWKGLASMSQVPPDSIASLSSALGVSLTEVLHDPSRGPCWVPSVKPEPNGYTRLKRSGRRLGTHRLALVAVGRQIPPRMHVDHLCRNTICCRPVHLDIVTPGENTRRGVSPSAVASVTGICEAGLHLLTPDNLVPAKVRYGIRACLACRRAYEAIYRQGAEYQARQRERQRARQADPRCREMHAEHQRQYLIRKRAAS